MESQQLGQIRGNGADHSGDSRQLCNGLQDGDKVRSRLGGDMFQSDKVSSIDRKWK